MVDPTHRKITIKRQCELLGLSRSGWYYRSIGESELNLTLMRMIDEQYTRIPFYGSPKMTAWLRRQGYQVNHKRVERLMNLMGLHAAQPRANTSRKHPENKIYPYLLAGVKIAHPDHVWSTDITYIQLAQGFLYLVAILDWYSRFVLAWRLSNTLDTHFCIEALEAALRVSQPEIFNTDQGTQFTSLGFTRILEDRDIRISMDGRGRVFDNIFVERLWRSVKYEEVYLKDYQTPEEAYRGLEDYFEFYNTERLHQALSYGTPQEAYWSGNGKRSQGGWETAPPLAGLASKVDENYLISV